MVVCLQSTSSLPHGQQLLTPLHKRCYTSSLNVKSVHILVQPFLLTYIIGLMIVIKIDTQT